MSLLDLLTLTVLTVVGIQLVQATRHAVSARRHLAQIVAGLRLRHLIRAVPVLAAVLLTLVILLQVRYLAFGWWTAIGGIGNPVFGASEHGLSGGAAWLLPAVFGALLLVSLPLLVEQEEWVFRRGAEERGLLANTAMALVFGLVHVVIGIPVGAGLALSIGGVYFTHVYLTEYRRTRSREAALTESTRAHLGYDVVIVALVLVALAFGL